MYGACVRRLRLHCMANVYRSALDSLHGPRSELGAMRSSCAEEQQEWLVAAKWDGGRSERILVAKKRANLGTQEGINNLA